MFRVSLVLLCPQEVINMAITTEEYRLLFNTITDSIMQLELLRDRLIHAQMRAEEIIINGVGSKPNQTSTVDKS